MLTRPVFILRLRPRNLALALGGGLLLALAGCEGFHFTGENDPKVYVAQSFEDLHSWGFSDTTSLTFEPKGEKWCMKTDPLADTSLIYRRPLAELIQEGGGNVPKTLKLTGTFNVPPAARSKLVFQMIRPKAQVSNLHADLPPPVERPVIEMVTGTGAWIVSKKTLDLLLPSTLEGDETIEFYMLWEKPTATGALDKPVFADDMKVTAYYE